MPAKTKTLLLAAALCGAIAAPAAAAAPVAKVSCPQHETQRGSSTFLSAISSKDPDGGSVTYSWDTNGDGAFGDPNESTFPQDANVTFSTPGGHPVRVLITDDEGEQATAECVIRIPAAPPKASFTTKRTFAFENTTIAFDASGSKGYDGDVVRYEWDFGGDGTYEESSASPRTTWAFPKSGRHDVVLRVTDSLGTTATTEDSIQVSNLAEHLAAIQGVRVKTHGPPKRNPAKPSGRFAVDGDVTRIQAFTLTNLPKMAAMDYWCEGPGCFKGVNPVKQLGRRAIFDWPVIGWELRAGDTIVVTVKCPGYKKRTIRVTARSGQQPLIR